MKYDRPKYLPGGDESLLVELGDELDVGINFLAHHIADSVARIDADGIVEAAPFLSSLLVHFDPDVLSVSELTSIIDAIVDADVPLEDLRFESRLITIPTLYFDEWTAAARQKYKAEINPRAEDDPDVVIRLNHLDDRDHLVRVHSGTTWWCAALGFWPGTGFFMPLDRKLKLAAPKYSPPRTFTPRGSVSLGGGISGVYPVDGPGGYQIFARTPVPIWDPEQRLPDFQDCPWLFAPRDRLRFVPCSREEYDFVQHQVDSGTYKIDISAYEPVALQDR